MIAYLSKRLAVWAVLVFVATNLTYFLANAMLDPRSNYVARRPPLPDSVVDATLSSYNLNDKVPLLELSLIHI